VTPGVVFSGFFLLAYGYIAFAHRHRAVAIWLAALLAIAVSMALRVFPGWNDVWEAVSGINYSVLMIFGGILLIAEVLIEAGIPGHVAARIVSVSKTYGRASVWFFVLSSAISMFVENVATVMIVAPIALEVARKLKANAVPLLIGIAVASNLQGTATLVGDPPSMILAAAENMNFNDFFWMAGRPGIFFAIQIGAVASFAFLYSLVRKDGRKLPDVAIPPVTSWLPAWLLGFVILGLAVFSFFFSGVGIQAGLLCAGGGAVAVVWHAFHRRNVPTFHRDGEEVDKRSSGSIVRGFDWDTLFLLAGIFFMVGSLEVLGVMDRVGSFLAGVAGGSPLKAFLLVVGSSVALSALIDNVPYVTVMIPVTQSIAVSMGGTDHLYLTFGLLVGACLGGNISPVGASANIVSVSLLRRTGYRVTFMEFVRIGLPFTLAAVSAGAAFVWLVWGP